MDLFLRIALESLSLLIGFVTLLLQQWKNTPGRWRRRLVTALALLLMVTAAVSIKLTLRDASSRSRAAAAQAHMLVQLDSLRTIEDSTRASGMRVEVQNSQLLGALKPFIQLAQLNYPGLETDTALRKLALDVKDLRNRDEFRPLAVQPRTALVQGVASLVREYSSETLEAVIYVGNDKRLQSIAGEMVEALREGGLGARIEYSMGGPIVDSSKSVFILTSAKSLPAAWSLAKALLPLFPDSVSAHRDDDSGGMMGIWLCHEPLFDSLGRVRFMGG